MLRLRLNVPALGRLGIIPLGLLAWLGFSPAGLAAPANDNFANAFLLVGVYGTTNGDNTTATAEGGEPSHAGLTPKASLWYKWTAAASGPVEFDTFNSSIDTVLAVYTAAPTPAPNTLNLVVANDDVTPSNPRNPHYPSSNDPYVKNPYLGPSGVKFNASLGTTYYIAVDGTAKGGSAPPARGPFTLTWAYHSSGVFRFTADLYYCSETESVNPRTGSTSPSPKGARLTITRLFGSSGKVHLTFNAVDGIAALGPYDIFAAAGADYNSPANTDLVFEDYELTKSIIIPINDESSPGIMPGGAFLNNGVRAGLCSPNRAFNVLLTAVALDPLEDPAVTLLSPPRIETLHGDSEVYIYDFDTDPLFPDLSVITNCPAFSTGNGLANPERQVFRCNEGVGTAVINVYRVGGDPTKGVETHYAIDAPLPSLNTAYHSFDLQAGSDYASPTNDAPPFDGADGPLSLNADFVRAYEDVGPDRDSQRVPAQNNYGTLKWGANDFTPRSIRIDIINDNLPEFNEDIAIILFAVAGHQQDMDFGNNNLLDGLYTPLTILYDDYPAGALDDSHNPDFNIATDPPFNTRPGTDGTINALVVQSDDKTIIGGNFVTFNATPRYGIARLNKNGQLDTSFDPGIGVPIQVGDFVSSLALAPGGKVAVGGSFSAFNGTARYNIAQLNGDGSLDNTFNPGTGTDGAVWTVAAQPDGKIIIGGEFTTVNGWARSHVARLSTDGTVDQSFDPGTNAINGTVNALALASDGTIYIGGDFSSVGGLPRHSIAKLDTNGVVLAAFDPITGLDGPVFALALQADGKPLVGGAFATIQGASRNNLARFNTDGTLDTVFDPGSGADDAVYSIALQNDGRIFFGGLFQSINQTRRLGLARLYPDGSVDTHFLDPAYCQYAGPHKIYYNPYVNPKDFLLAVGVQSDGNVMIGGSFQFVGGGRFTSQVITNSPAPAEDLPNSRTTYRVRANVARLLGGDTEGPGNIGFVAPTYSAPENLSFLYVKLARVNGSLGPIETTFSLPPKALGPGVAQSGVDYIYNRVNPRYDSAWSADVRENSEGIFGTNNISIDRLSPFTTPPHTVQSTLDDVFVTIPHRLGFQGDRSVPFKLDMPSYSDSFFLGGENVPLGSALAGAGLSRALLNIFEVDVLPGVIGFSSPTYSVNETGTNALITLTRTNGSVGTVTVRFATTNGTAIAGTGQNYLGVTNTITFRDGQTSTNILVPVLHNPAAQPDLTVLLYLSNPGNGATLGLANAVLSIIDNDFLPGHINLTSTNYSVGELDGAVAVTATRTGGSLGTMDVQFATSNSVTAVSPTDYIGTNGTLHWDDADSAPRTVTIPVNHDGLVTSNKTFGFRIFNPSVGNALGPRSNAVVTIVNQDFYGILQFSAPSYNVNENGGFATITVNRIGGIAGTITANYATANGNAQANSSYTSTSGTLSFGPGLVSQSFNVPILDDNATDPNPFFFTVTLSGFTPASTIPASGTNATIFIIDNHSFDVPPGDLDTSFNPLAGFNDDVLGVALQPDGKLVAAGAFTTANGLAAGRIARLTTTGDRDFAFMTGLAGPNDIVRALINQSDTRLVVGGNFTTVHGVVRNFIARLNYDGSLDTGFNPGSGADAPVFALAETFVNGLRKVMIGGAFNTFNGALRSGIVRLNDDGSVDASFNNGVGANGPVFAVAVYPTNSLFAGKIVIGGDFTTVNGVPRNRIARLNLDGTVDTTFLPGNGADSTVRSIALQFDGRALIGGVFTNVNGVARSRIARLNGDGTVDNSFQPGQGANDSVSAIILQPDNRIVVSGQFTRASGVTRNRLTRLMPNGAVDPTINFGSGADNFVACVAIQPDGKLVLGGGFTQYKNQPRPHLARIYGGSMVGSGSFRFELANYFADENSTNVLVNIIRNGGTSGPLPDGSGDIFVAFNTANGTAFANVNYSNVALSLDFPAGETLQTVSIPLIDDNQITPDLTVNLLLSNPTPPSTLGPQPTAVLTIINVDSSVSFSSATYSRAENAIDGFATIHVLRNGTTRNAASVDFMTTFGGTAIPGVNYAPVSNTITFLPDQTDLIEQIPIFHDPSANGDRTVTMQLSNPFGTLLVSPSSAVLTIVDVDQAPGQFTFSAPVFSVSEAGTSITLQVIRTNGHSGVVSVAYATASGTAVAGVRYASTNGVLTFADGETVKTLTVGIINDNLVLGNQFFLVNLSNPTGGASLGAINSVSVMVLEDDAGVSFSSPVYVVSETTPQVTLNILRPFGTNVATHVNYATTNGSALAGTNYGATSGTLTFNPGETLKTLTLNIIHDPRVTGNLSFGVVLSSPGPNAQLTFPGSANVIILDAEAGVSLLTNSLSVLENASNALITVVCSNPNAGNISVGFATADDTALSNVDYVPVSGIINFTNGITTNTILVPIIDNLLVDGNRSFNFNLFNVSAPGVLTAPTTETITIIDNDAGLSFSSSSYTVLKSGVAATIPVVRAGFTNSIVSVSYTTVDGTATNGLDYTAVSGTLTFDIGQTVTNFSVPVIDSTVIKPDRTVFLQLFNAVGNVSLVPPSAATLVIHDNSGSLVIAAGSTITGESNPNGFIDPGETVTLLFAFRNTAGTNTANLTATLLTTNGITSPSGPQNYGALVVNGPPVSRSFTFTANGTNGQTILATFHLMDGAIDRGSAVFTYTLGTASTSFRNPSLITINDNTNATPYPATLNVSGVGGTLQHLTVTLSNVNHTFPSDIEAILVSPTGQKMLLMANCGSGALHNGNLTFDDAAANSLPSAPNTPQSGPIASGTYKPTVYLPVSIFPVPAPPAPYATTLSAFNGFNPNGVWSLYILDDLPSDSGAISNGWSLNLTTAGQVGSAADVLTAMTASNSIIVTSNLVYNIAVTNFGPSPVANVMLTDTFQANAQFVSASPGYSLNGNTLSFNLGPLAKDAYALVTVTVRPTVTGSVSNTVVVLAVESDPNPINNTNTMITTVVSPTSDLLVTMAATPNPILLGDTLVYSLVVSNQGPSSAPNVLLTNTLPPAVAFISSSPPNVPNGNVLLFNLGTVTNHTQTPISIYVRPLAIGTLTNNASVGSSLTDPHKVDNTASVKTIVEQFTVGRVGNNLVLSWPNDVGSYVLESATNLASPIVWSLVTSPPPVLVGGQYTVTIGMTNKVNFFHLRKQ